MRDTCALTSLSRTSIHRLRSEGRFPCPVELGEKRIAFSRAEVLAWISARLAARRASA
ncbi:AlpA family phage regulatory protein [Shinella sp. 838]|nr:AlpA family phage regulatory protein [Shinella sp. 838]MDG4671640.1 AlpA family phage regulatory protein [Shinella sp. 838]